MTVQFQQLRAPFLITTRHFPTEEVELENHLNKMYFEVSTAVNSREIGIYEKAQINTGQRWFNTGNPSNRLQAFRQVYTIPTLAIGDNNTIYHNINVDVNTQFTHIYGTANNPNTQFVPLPYVDGSGGGDNIGIYVTKTQIHIVTSTANWVNYNAIIVLEYILNN
jgi:hypothetical protein